MMRPCPEHGFSLIEVMACLVVVALLAGIAAISLHGPQQTLQMQDIQHRIAHMDRLSREHARRHNVTGNLIYNLQRQTLNRMVNGEGGGSAASESAELWALPRGYEFAELRLVGQPPALRELAIAYSQHGHSPTYAVKLLGPGRARDDQRPSQWLLVAGLTGQVTSMSDETEALAVLAALEHDHDQ